VSHNDGWRLAAERREMGKVYAVHRLLDGELHQGAQVLSRAARADVRERPLCPRFEMLPLRDYGMYFGHQRSRFIDRFSRHRNSFRKVTPRFMKPA
jgi:hypothetical protein